MKADPKTVFDEIRYQADVLGNLIRAIELTARAYEGGDAEIKVFVPAVAAQLFRRLEPHHRPSTLSERLGLPGELSDLMESVVSENMGEVKSRKRREGRQLGEVTALLWDADESREGFLCTIRATRGGPRDSLGSTTALESSFIEATRDARYAVLELLGSRGRLSPSSVEAASVRFELELVDAATGGGQTRSGPLGESAGRYTPVHEWEKTGRSAGAAAAVAYTSLLIGEPVPEGVAVTGAVSLDGAIEKVAAVEEKLRAVFRERPGLSSVYVPAGQAPSDDRAREVGTLAEMIDLVFGREATSSLPAKAISVEATVRRGLHLYEKSNDFTAARYVLESALDAIRGHRGEDVAPDRYRLEEFLCLWRLASCLVQLGDTEAAGGLYEEARPLGATLWREQILDPRHHLGFMGNLAVYLRDVYRFEDAERLLVDTIQSQRMLRQSKRELARTLGNLGELRTMMGSWLKRSVGIDDRKRANEGVGVVGDEVRAEPDFACNRADVMAQAEDKFRQAAADLQEALEMIEAVYADEVPREYCYLGNLALARDEPERALELHRKGLSANETVEIGRERNEWFLGYGIVRALIASERYTAAVEEAHDVAVRIPAHEPYPRQLILRYAGQGLLACGKTERGKDVLLKAADLTFAQGALVRFGLSCALGDLAIHLLSEGDESARKEAVEHAAAFAARAEAVPGLDVAKGLSARVDELARGGAEGFARLSSELCRAVGWFLY